MAKYKYVLDKPMSIEISGKIVKFSTFVSPTDPYPDVTQNLIVDTIISEGGTHVQPSEVLALTIETDNIESVKELKDDASPN